jgi:hypothetical protein
MGGSRAKPAPGRAVRLRARIATVLAAAVVATLGLASRGTPRLQADSAIQVKGTPQVQNGFPTEAVFSIDLTSNAGDLSDVTLHWQFPPSNVGNSGHADFDPGSTVHAQYHLRTSGNSGYEPPTKTIRYYWTATDKAGNQLQTDPVDWSYDDPRFQFKKVSNGNLTLYYYSGSDANAQRVLNIGRQALDKAGQLDGATVDFPVHLVAYANQADVTPALSHESASVDPNILGQALPPDTVVLDIGNLTGADNDDTVRHELTHLVNASAVAGPYKEALPLWLDEGLAVFAQQDPGGFDSFVAQAIRRDSVVPLTSLSPGLRGTNAGLFYGEAWSIVNFLVSKYGPEKMAQLLAQFKGGATEDKAFQQAYGMDRSGVYDAWRQSVGLRSAAAPQATQQAAPSRNSSQQQPQPTQSGSGSNAVATAPPAPAPKPSSRSSGDSSSDTVTAIALAVGGTALLLALLGGAVIGGLAMSRRGQR